MKRKSLFWIIFSILACVMINTASIINEPSVQPNINSDSYIQINIQEGDSVWSIASRHVVKSQDIRELVVAIRELNALNRDATVYPGQVLKIPSIKRVEVSLNKKAD